MHKEKASVSFPISTKCFIFSELLSSICTGSILAIGTVLPPVSSIAENLSSKSSIRAETLSSKSSTRSFVCRSPFSVLCSFNKRSSFSFSCCIIAVNSSWVACSKSIADFPSNKSRRCCFTALFDAIFAAPNCIIPFEIFVISCRYFITFLIKSRVIDSVSAIDSTAVCKNSIAFLLCKKPTLAFFAITAYSLLFLPLSSALLRPDSNSSNLST